MKILKKYLILFIAVTSLLACNSRNNPNKESLSQEANLGDTIIVHETAIEQPEDLFEDEKAIRMLKEFYTAYITESLSENYSRLQDLGAMYSTKQLQDRIEKDNRLDFDPYTHAQDHFDNWLPSLQITKDEAIPYIFNVSMYSWEDDEWPHTITIFVKKENDAYKIDDTFMRMVLK